MNGYETSQDDRRNLKCVKILKLIAVFSGTLVSSGADYFKLPINVDPYK